MRYLLTREERKPPEERNMEMIRQYKLAYDQQKAHFRQNGRKLLQISDYHA